MNDTMIIPPGCGTQALRKVLGNETDCRECGAVSANCGHAATSGNRLAVLCLDVSRDTASGLENHGFESCFDRSQSRRELP
jgi:hypothetical protein